MMSSLGWSKLFSMPKCGGVQLHRRIRNSPDALALGDAGLLTYDSTWRVGPSIDGLGELSIDRRNWGDRNFLSRSGPNTRSSRFDYFREIMNCPRNAFRCSQRILTSRKSSGPRPRHEG